MHSSTSAFRKPRNKFGFTLIELLVVIAIIGLLAAILFPVFSRARESARRSTCQSNLKQIALGVQQYLQDNDEKYPFAGDRACDLPSFPACGSGVLQTNPNMPGSFQTTAPAGIPGYFVCWMDSIQPYVKSSQIFTCICAKYPHNANYMYNPYVSSHLKLVTGWWPNTAPLNASQIKRPSETMGWMDLNSPYGIYFTRGDYLLRVQQHPDEVLIHFDGDNVAFLDGHVKWFGNTNSTLGNPDNRMWDATLD